MKRTCIVILAALWLLSFPAAADAPRPEDWIEGIFRWREQNGGAYPPDQAGTSPFDWYAFDAALLGRGDPGPYLSALQKAAQGEGGPVTDLYRRGLVLTALGGDPTDLILRGIARREALGRQGASAYIWSLILLDARQTPLPPDSLYTREDLVSALLSYQTEAGGFSLEGRIPDADMTAMALCALYPYRQDCREQTDRAWQWLSDTQLADGGFQSWGHINCESTAQVAVALCSWGRDPMTDPLFVKEGRTLFHALEAYRREDGGFAHTPEGDTNITASEQVLRACTAYRLLKSGKGRLYDLSRLPAPVLTTAGTTAGTTAVATTAASAVTTVISTSVTAAVTTAVTTAAPTSLSTAGDAAPSTEITTAATAVQTAAASPSPKGTSPLWLILPAALLPGIGLYIWRRRR